MDKNHSSDQVKPSNNAHTRSVFSRFPPLTFTFFFLSALFDPPFLSAYFKVSQRIADVVFWKLGIGAGNPPLSGSYLLQSLANNDSITLAAGLNIGAGLLSG